MSVIFDAISPDKVFLFLVNSSGAVALFCYVLIAVAELRMRRRLEAEAPERLKLRMWLFPWLTYAAIAAMVAVIVAMALVDDVRSQLIPSFISLAVVLVAGWLRYRQAGARAGVAQHSAEPHVARGAAAVGPVGAPRDGVGGVALDRVDRAVGSTDSTMPMCSPPHTMRSPGLGCTPGPAGVARPVRWAQP